MAFSPNKRLEKLTQQFANDAKNLHRTEDNHEHTSVSTTRKVKRMKKKTNDNLNDFFGKSKTVLNGTSITFTVPKIKKVTPELITSNNESTSFRLTEKTYQKLKEQAKKQGMNSVNDFLKAVISPYSELSLNFDVENKMQSENDKSKVKIVRMSINKLQRLRLEELKKVLQCATYSKALRILAYSDVHMQNK